MRVVRECGCVFCFVCCVLCFASPVRKANTAPPAEICKVLFPISKRSNDRETPLTLPVGAMSHLHTHYTANTKTHETHAHTKHTAHTNIKHTTHNKTDNTSKHTIHHITSHNTHHIQKHNTRTRSKKTEVVAIAHSYQKSHQRTR